MTVEAFGVVKNFEIYDSLSNLLGEALNLYRLMRLSLKGKNMTRTITISEDVFEEMIRKKEEFDAIVESIELMNRHEVKEAINNSKEDIKAGRIHKLKDILKK